MCEYIFSWPGFDCILSAMLLSRLADNLLYSYIWETTRPTQHCQNFFFASSNSNISLFVLVKMIENS